MNANPWFNAPTRALSAADDAFKTLISRMELKREAFDQMVKETGNVSGFKLDEDIYAKLLDQKIGVNGEIVDKKLLQTAKEATFQQDLTGFIKSVDNTTKQSVVTQYFMPFIKTPANIMVYGAEFVPGVNRFIGNFNKVINGTDEVEKAIYRGRAAMGWMAISGGVSLALTDQMTGAGPVDKEKRKLWLKTHQPHSLMVPGIGWVSYKSIEPINTIFALTADLAELAQAGDDTAYNKSFGQLAYSIADGIYNKSYFDGLNSALAFFNPVELAKGDGRMFKKEFYNAINSFIPYSGARRQLSQALDQNLYEYKNELDRMLGGAVPGMNKFVGTERTDIFTGETEERVTGNLLNNLLPFSIRQGEDDLVINELVDKGVDVQSAQGDVLMGVELTPDDQNEINRRVAEYGLHKNLEDLFKRGNFKQDYINWKNAPPDQRGDIRDSGWHEAILEEFQEAYKAARDSYVLDNEEFRLKYNEAQTTKYRAGLGNYTGNTDMSTEITDLIDISGY
jgi:hypothetical protein